MDLKNEIGLVKAEKAYKAVLIVSFSVIVLSALGWVVVYLKTQQQIDDISSKVVVINSGVVSEGSVMSVSPAELYSLQAQNVLRIGVEYLYSFSSSNYDDRIDMAKAFWGKSGKEIIQGYINENVRQKVVQNNLRVDVSIKDLEIVLENNEYKGRIVFEQSFINADVRQVRVLEIVCAFAQTQISSKNAYGMVIENAYITEL